MSTTPATIRSPITSPLKRRKSLRLPTQPPPIPIPPSLRQSPFLNSPQSIFKRDLSTPRPLSQEDELWLQDTVPLSPHSGSEPFNQFLSADGQQERVGHSISPGLFVQYEQQLDTRGRCRKTRDSTLRSPSPSIIWRAAHAGYTTRPAWLLHTQIHSEPIIPRLSNDATYRSVSPS